MDLRTDTRTRHLPREQEQAQMAAALRRVPLFSSLGPAAVGEIARAARRHRYERDDVVFYQGDPGDTFYVILDGQVKVSVSSAEGQEAILVMLDTGDGNYIEVFEDLEYRPAPNGSVVHFALRTTRLDGCDPGARDGRKNHDGAKRRHPRHHQWRRRRGDPHFPLRRPQRRDNRVLPERGNVARI